MTSRRKFISNSILAGSSLLIAPSWVNGLLAQSNTNDDFVKQAKELHKQILTLDSHADTPLWMSNKKYDFEQNNSSLQGSKVDLMRMQEGGLWSVFFAVFLGQTELTPENREKAYNDANNIFDLINTKINQNIQGAALAYEPEDALKLKKLGKRAIYLGMENGFPIGLDLSRIAHFYKKGARYITLCHSSTDKNGKIHEGVSAFGEKVIAEMERLGIMSDVSHISEDSFADVMRLSKKPIIASHSSSRAICDHPRNLNDEQLRQIAYNGGVAQLCILSDYVKAPTPNPDYDAAMQIFSAKYPVWEKLTPEQRDSAVVEYYAIEAKYPGDLATVKQAIDHLDHMIKVTGIEHVGIGTDFDGGGGLADCADVSQLYMLTAEMLRRNYTESDIEKIWSGNFIRVFAENRKAIK